MFGERFARQAGASYRKHGLDAAAQRMVDWLTAWGIEGKSVLEIGGGVGQIQLELLRRGAAHATNVELSDGYEAVAASLAEEAGLTGRIERRLGDLAVDGQVAELADVVILHRVVCCYPDLEALLTAAAQHARHAVILTHPPRTVLSRAGLAVSNTGLRLLRREYRTYVHPPQTMVSVLQEHGFEAHHLPSGYVWRVLAATRTRASTGAGT